MSKKEPNPARERFYDIYGLMKIQANLDLMVPTVFESSEIEKIDLQVCFKNFDSNQRSWREVVSNFYVSSQGVLYKEPALALPTVVHLSHSNGVMEINANSPSFRLNRRPGTRFLNFFLKLIFAGLASKDHCLVHGGGVRIGKTMVLLLGTSNSGKSTMTWMLVKDKPGAEYFGDDLLVCRQDGLIKPYPVVSRIHSKFLESIGRPPTRFYEMTDLTSGMPNEFALASLIRSLPFYPWARMFAEAYGPWHYENIIEPTHASLKTMEAKPSLLLFIEKGVRSVQKLTRNETVRRLRVLQQLEFGVESDVLLNLSALIYGVPDMEKLHNVQESWISSVASRGNAFIVNDISQAHKILDSL